MSNIFGFGVFVVLIILFFWGMKVYYICKSENWEDISGEIVKMYPESSQKSTVVGVKYSYFGREYINDALDSGNLASDRNVEVGQLVILKVNPNFPERCVVRSEPTNPYTRSAHAFAKIISKTFSSKR